MKISSQKMWATVFLYIFVVGSLFTISLITIFTVSVQSKINIDVVESQMITTKLFADQRFWPTTCDRKTLEIRLHETTPTEATIQYIWGNELFTKTINPPDKFEIENCVEVSIEKDIFSNWLLKITKK